METNFEPVEGSTGSRTIADLMAIAAVKHADKVAVRHKVGDLWVDVTYAEVGLIVSEIGRGLIALGVQSGDRVAILCETRPEWTYADFGVTSAGAVVVPVYPTNSPQECEWVVGNSEAIAVICEDAKQVAKIVEVRERLPNLTTIIVVDPSGDVGDAIAMDEVRTNGRQLELSELTARYSAITPEDPFTFIYTSGTTGPPKGCVLTHGNYRSVISMSESLNVLSEGEDVYLFLPLAHAFAILIQLLSFDLGSSIAYWTGDPQKIVAELIETKPTYFPSVPRIFEKLYTLASKAILAKMSPDQFAEMVAMGVKVRDMQIRGEELPGPLIAAFASADEQVFANVRALFGGNLRQAVTGAAPISKEILEFFYAAGVPVLEGYGMTETATVATYSTIEHHRFGTVGRPLPGCEVKIASDGEILIKGANIFRGYYKNDDASFGAVIDGWLHTGDLGSVDGDGYVKITGRKKDIIITAGGKNLTPANVENDLKQCRWISQAVMHGDRRPYPVVLVTLDSDEITAWATEQGLPLEIATLAQEPRVRAMIQEALDSANQKYANVEQVKKFAILDHDLTQETGELTPTLKVKRNVVNEKYAAIFDALYDE
ncbi:MAG: AMP-dependent synthetase/ligase [Actinomycetota bacterium]